jgi:GT2 family glycosyltransferase
MSNRGYGAAANVGFARAAAHGATAVMLLNDDVVVHAGWLPPLVDALDGSGVGAVQPLLLADGDSGTVNSAGVEFDRYGAGVDVLRGGAPPHGTPTDLRCFTGGAVLFDRQFLNDTGGFDERFFLYYEDVDLALRGSELGWRYLLVPESTVDHVGGVTTSTMADRTRYLQERNRLGNAFRHLPATTVVGAVWLSMKRLRHRPRGVHARALVAGLAAAPGALWRRARRRTDRRTIAAPSTGEHA